MRNWKRFIAALAATPLAAVLAALHAQTAGQSTAPSLSTQGPDALFIQQAGQRGMAEVELGRLAGTASASEAVRKMAKRMVWDHTQSNRELALIGAHENIALPKTLDAEHERLLEVLSSRRGPEFDRVYVQAMRDDHEKLQVLLSTAEATVTTDELRAYIRKTQPMVGAHLQMTKSM